MSVRALLDTATLSLRQKVNIRNPHHNYTVVLVVVREKIKISCKHLQNKISKTVKQFLKVFLFLIRSMEVVIICNNITGMCVYSFDINDLIWLKVSSDYDAENVYVTNSPKEIGEQQKYMKHCPEYIQTALGSFSMLRTWVSHRARWNGNQIRQNQAVNNVYSQYSHIQ